MPRKPKFLRAPAVTWSYIFKAFKNAGFTDSEAMKAADSNIYPRREPGRSYIRHRKLSVEIYMEDGYSRKRAIELAHEDLVRHNKKKGNEEDFIFSEGYAR